MSGLSRNPGLRNAASLEAVTTCTWPGWTLAVCALALLVAVGPGCGRVEVPRLLQDAATAARDGRWNLALDLTGKCLTAEPRNTTVLVFHGICLYEMRRADDALEILETAAALAPEEFASQFFYGWILCEKRRFGDAIVPLRKAHSLSATHQDALPDLLCLLARCCLEQNLDEGFKYLSELRKFRAFSEAPEVYNALGVMWLHRGSLAKAKENFLKAHERDRQNGIVCQNLAVMYDHYLRDPTLAMRYYQYSLKASQTANDPIRLARIQTRLRQMARERMAPAAAGSGGR